MGRNFGKEKKKKTKKQKVSRQTMKSSLARNFQKTTSIASIGCIIFNFIARYPKSIQNRFKSKISKSEKWWFPFFT